MLFLNKHIVKKAVAISDVSISKWGLKCLVLSNSKQNILTGLQGAKGPFLKLKIF